MEEKKQKLINTDNEKKSAFFHKEKFPTITENFIKLKSLKNNNIKLDAKIEQDKSIIHDLFIKNFGPNFFKRYSIIDEFKYMFGENILDISTITTVTQEDKNKNKKIVIKKKKKRKIDEKKLSSRINMGSMTYLNLMENTVSKKSLFNDKIFLLSKNFEVSKKNKKDIDIPNKPKNENSIKNKINYLKSIKIKSLLKNKNKSNNNNNEVEKFHRIKLIRNSMSQNDINSNNVTNVINLKKNLIYNKFKKEHDSETVSPINQQHFETEEINNNINSISNKILLENKYSNLNTNFSISQNDFFSSEISNYNNPKDDKISFETERKNIKPIYIDDNMGEVDITNNIINNNYKSLSTYEANKDMQSPKKIFKKYNSIVNLNTFYNTKKFKEYFNKDVNLLNTFINKNNNRLVKLIDHNFTKNIERNKIKQNKNKDNFNLISAVMDKKKIKKIFDNYNKQKKITKAILLMSQKDENKIKDNDNKAEKKYFIENFKKMDDNLALYYIEKLYNTKYISFPLKEYKKKRIEIKKKKEKEKFLNIKNRLDNNSALITKYRYRLIREYNKHIQDKEN